MKRSHSSVSLKSTLVSTLMVECIKIGTAIGARLLVLKIRRYNYEQLPWWKKVFTSYPK